MNNTNPPDLHIATLFTINAIKEKARKEPPKDRYAAAYGGLRGYVLYTLLGHFTPKQQADIKNLLDTLETLTQEES